MGALAVIYSGRQQFLQVLLGRPAELSFSALALLLQRQGSATLVSFGESIKAAF
jgi:hypothetical protein